MEQDGVEGEILLVDDREDGYTFEFQQIVMVRRD